MTAWKRYAAGMTIAALSAVIVGCSSSQGSQVQRLSGDGMGANLPSWEAAEASEVQMPDIQSDTHLAAGRYHESRGLFAQAAEQYRMAVELDPENEEAQNRLGIVLVRLQAYEAAETALKRAIELEPNQAHLHNNLAFCYMTVQRWPEAKAELERAIELRPKFPRAHINLGMVLAQMGQYDKALAEFRRGAPLADAYYNLGLMYQAHRQPARAASAYKTALQLNEGLVAAKKHMDQLPPEIVKAARPMKITATPPVVETTPEEKAEDADPATTTRPADVSPSTQPAGETTNADEQADQVEDMPDQLSLLIDMSMDVAGIDGDERCWVALGPILVPEDLVYSADRQR
jgi:Flp pilus assembly protein TadD